MNRKIYFMRHGESEANVQGVLCGSGWDAELSLIGTNQVVLASQQLKGQPFSNIFTSPLKRAVNSAEIVLRVLPETQVTIRDELQEQFYGDWEGRSFEEVRKDFLLKLDPPNGETYLLFKTRLQKVLDEILQLEGNILIVAHGGVGSELMEMMGHPKRLIDNGEIICFQSV